VHSAQNRLPVSTGEKNPHQKLLYDKISAGIGKASNKDIKEWIRKRFSKRSLKKSRS
jgi:hypothetical protein